MLTFTQRKQQVVKLCGINYSDPLMDMIVNDLNTADKLLENAARRPWTRKQKIANITASKQYYQIASDMHRVSEIKCLIATGSPISVPLQEVASEYDWNKLNSFPFKTSYPTHYFIRGNDEIGLYPCPSQNVTNGLIVTYEPRVRDMGIEDKTFTADIVQNSNVISNPDSTGLPGGFKDYMTENFWIKSNSGEDGNWYKIQQVVSTTQAKLDNNYLGPTGTGISFTMGQVPPYPEEYHEAPVFYACSKFFAMRKDTESETLYRERFNEMLRYYREVYGSKTTGGVVNPGKRRVPNISDVFANGTITEG